MDFVVISLPMSLRWEESDESWFEGSSNLSPRLDSFLVLRSISEFSIASGAENEVKEGRGVLLGLEVGAMAGHRARLKDRDVGKGATRAWERVLREHREKRNTLKP